ncbi:hypothetical protein RSO01_21210 [Reyranella soli]|jgi:hypothetical protein|uniref:DUF1579 domain-containing protein n=2 Tax=Reyranella soli TaxID=1230389 RepID=A0A512N7J5_9HYPH|nr:hypothetical protein RSO01_21210 [Reyranella soli]
MSWKWFAALAAVLLPSDAAAESRRLCDMPLTWSYVEPASAVPARYQGLMGLWTGSISFSGSSESTRMCLAVAIHEVKVDGQAKAAFSWNMGDGNESANMVSKGVAPVWWAHTAVLVPEKGEQLVFAADAPYRGRWYRYVLDFPSKQTPDTMTGYLYASRQGSATDRSPAAWMNTVEAHRVTLRRMKDSLPPLPAPGVAERK